MIKTILIFLFSLSFLYGASIEGQVSEDATHEVLCGINIIVKNTNISVFSDIDGYFKASSLPAGKVILTASSDRYYTQNFPVFIKDTSEVVRIEIRLSKDTNDQSTTIVTGNWPSPDIEYYHSYFQSLKPEKILSITMDSLSVDSSDFLLNVYSTFHNESGSMEYICVCIKCLSMAEPVIYNSHGQKININPVSYYMGEKTSYPSHFINIEPHSSIKYPTVYLSLYAFDSCPPDTYYIKIEYINKQYHSNMSLRGDYISKDSLIYCSEKFSK